MIGPQVPLVWRKSSKSQSNGQCLEAALRRKSSRSNNSGECVETAMWRKTHIAIRDSKLDPTGDYPVLTIPTTDWTALLTAVTA